jgi:hypothetical protein
MMDFIVKVLETDDEVTQLIPLVIEFSRKTDISLYQSLYEIFQGFKNPTSLTIIVKKDGVVTGYINGVFLTKSEFLGSQVFSSNPQTNLKSFVFIEKKLRELGCKKIFMHTHLEPIVFAKYGFKFDRYLLVREVKEEE